MATCVKCGKKGVFLKLRDGLCRECFVESILETKSADNPMNDEEFFNENIEMIRTIEYEIENNRKRIENTRSYEEKIRFLNTNIDLYKELEAYCVSKGEDGDAFFERNFRHIGNEDSSYIQYELDMLKKIGN